MSFKLSIKPVCHICYQPLSMSPYILGQYNCINSKCPLNLIVERCRVSYDPIKPSLYFKSCLFTIPENNIWYQLSINDNSIKLIKTKLIESNNKLPKADGPAKSILDLEKGFKILLDDNLVEKVPKLLARAKKLIIFS